MGSLLSTGPPSQLVPPVNWSQWKCESSQWRPVNIIAGQLMVWDHLFINLMINSMNNCMNNLGHAMKGCWSWMKFVEHAMMQLFIMYHKCWSYYDSAVDHTLWSLIIAIKDSWSYAMIIDHCHERLLIIRYDHCHEKAVDHAWCIT